MTSGERPFGGHGCPSYPSVNADRISWADRRFVFVSASEKIGQVFGREVVALLDASAAEVTFKLAVDGVVDGHVVGRHALGDGAGSSADAEEPADVR